MSIQQFFYSLLFFIYQNKNDLNKIIETLFISLKISFIAVIFIAYSNNFDPDAFYIIYLIQI